MTEDAQEILPVSNITSAWMRNNSPECCNVVLIMMRKGGAGKTSATLALADALRRLGLNVLVVDLDSQGHASVGLGRKVHLVQVGTTGLGKPKFEPDVNTVCEVIDAGAPGIADQAIQIVDWPCEQDETFARGGPLFQGKIGTIGLIPCYIALESMVPDWRTLKDKKRLGTALLDPEDPGGVAPHARWDVVLIDTPPGGSDIHVMGAFAAHWVQLIAPMQKFAGEAVPETMQLVDSIHEEYDRKLDVISLIINEFSAQKRRTQQDILDDLARGKTGENSRLFRAPEAPARIPALSIIQDSQGYEAPVSAFLSEAKRLREPARRVCQAFEANAIHMLRTIGHPDAREIEAAWVDAWPRDMREPFVKAGD